MSVTPECYTIFLVLCRDSCGEHQRRISPCTHGNGGPFKRRFMSINADYAIMIDGDDMYPISVVTEMLRAKSVRMARLCYAAIAHPNI
jgi:hypothetical protein